jgi:hypothetical protein
MEGCQLHRFDREQIAGDENPMWVNRRIQGELQKIGIDLSTSIRRITAPNRRPEPKRDTWRQFMVSQACRDIPPDQELGLKGSVLLLIRCGPSHFLRTSSRCQRRSVSG